MTMISLNYSSRSNLTKPIEELKSSLLAIYATLIVLVTLQEQAIAQQIAAPLGLSHKMYQSIAPWQFPARDSVSFTQRIGQQSSRIAQETVGYNYKTKFTPSTSGTWKTVLPGVDSWFLKLKSNGAYGLALVLSDVDLVTDETLYIYNLNGQRGPYTTSNIPPSGILPIDFLQGDEVMIEYNVPATSKHHGSFMIETVSHAYRNIFMRNTNAARTASDCYVCLDSDTIQKQRRSVVKLVVLYDSISKFCTGTLMNNTAHDNKPYILTAEHCITNQFDADRTVAVFGFEDVDCVGGQIHFDDYTLSGAYHRAALFENDFSLIEMYDKPRLEFHPYYAGWDITDKDVTRVTSVHHPQGGPKKISISNGKVNTSTYSDGNSRAQNAFWNIVRWDVGVTEGGSSGAPLFNKHNTVIGTLSGGSSACGTPYNDYYEKLSFSWEASPYPQHQLKYWLDPIYSGIKVQNGNDPFSGINAICNTQTNVNAGEQQDLLPFANGDGFFSGYNADGIASYAERFNAADSSMLTGVTLNVGSVNVESEGGLLVGIRNNDNGLPDDIISETYLPYNYFKPDSENFVDFYPYVKLKGVFFVDYTLAYSPKDSFALKQVEWRSNTENTAFVKGASGWAPITSISPDGKGSSFGIKVTLCENKPTTPSTEEPVHFYPNPATTVLIADLPAGSDGIALQVYNLQGQRQNVQYEMYENNAVITTADLSPGVYIVRISTQHSVFCSKFFKQ